jgi:hypothetical protein
VRLELDVGAGAEVLLHSYRGRERHTIGRFGPALAAPTRAFGIRVETGAASAASGERAGDAGPAPRLGATRLVLHAPGAAAALDALAAGAASVAAAWAVGAPRPDDEMRLAALEADLQELADATGTAGGASA